MKISTCVAIALGVSCLLGGVAGAQTGKRLPAQNFYYDDAEWPLPPDGGSTTLTLNGMSSAHAVWMTFSRYTDGKTVTDAPTLTLLEGSTIKWIAPAGCAFELQLVNSNPPVINMRRPSAMCALNPNAKVIFKILAAP